MNFVDHLTNLCPKDANRYFFFDRLMIQDVVDAWNSETLKLSSNLIPSYGNRWGYYSADLPTLSGFSQIPSDLVVKAKLLILLRLLFPRSGERASSKHHVKTGNRGASCSHHWWPIGLPRNPGECGFLHRPVRHYGLAFF